MQLWTNRWALSRPWSGRAFLLLEASSGLALRNVGLGLLCFGMAAASVTFNWVVDHDTAANLFPEFAGRVVYLSDIFVWSGLAFWATGWYLSRPASWKWGPWYAALPLVFLTCLSLLSVLWAQDPAQAVYTAGRRAWLIMLYLVLVNEGTRSLRPAVLALLIIGLLQAGVALGQLIKGQALGAWYLGEITRGALGYEGIGSPRAYGLGFNPNPVGLFLAVTSATLYGLFLLTRTRWPIRALIAVPFVATYIALRGTDSRAGLLGWILGVLVVSSLTWLAGSSTRWIIVRRLGLAVLIVLVAEGYFYVTSPQGAPNNSTLASLPSSGLERVGRRFSADEVSIGLSGRIADANQSIPIIRENLLFGVGAGNYSMALRHRLNPESVGIGYVPVHNVPLLLTAELGIAGGVAWVMLMAAPAIWVLTSLRPAYFGSSSLLWLGPLLVLLFVGVWEFTPWATQDGRVLMMGIFGLWAGSVAASKPPKAAHVSVPNSSPSSFVRTPLTSGGNSAPPTPPGPLSQSNYQVK